MEADIVSVEIDENTTAEELVRKVLPDDLKRYMDYIHFAVVVNGVVLRDEDKVMRRIEGEDDDIRVVPTVTCD